MTTREQRFRYSRPVAEDRASMVDRILWTTEDHPIGARVLYAIAGFLITIVIIDQTWLAIARHVATASHAVGP